jgi:hypothetical protein
VKQLWPHGHLLADVGQEQLLKLQGFLKPVWLQGLLTSSRCY